MDKKIKNYKISGALLVIFIGLNVWLLYEKVNLQQENNLLQDRVLINEISVENKEELVQFNPPETGTQFPQQGTFGLIAIFTDKGCNPCVKEEIEYLNKLNDSFNNMVKVYYTGIIPEYLEGHGARFNYSNVKSPENYFNIKLPIDNPVSVLVDGNNTVQSIHINDLSKPGSYKRREIFYARINSIFETLNK